MVYESKAVGFSITLSNGGMIRFKRKLHKLAGGDVMYGEVDTKDKNLQEAVQMSEEQLNAVIEKSDAYTGGVVGQLGVWRQEERLREQNADGQITMFEQEIRQLTDEELRRACANLGVSVSVEASRSDLVAALGAKKQADNVSLSQVLRAAISAEPVVVTGGGEPKKPAGRVKRTLQTLSDGAVPPSP